MTPQEIFNTVTTHLLKQNAKSIRNDDDDTCAYRGESGMMCAVGVLLPDSVYLPEMEGHLVGMLANAWTTLPDWFYTNRVLLADLQEVHDFRKVEEWPLELKTLANELGLTLPKELQ